MYKQEIIIPTKIADAFSRLSWKKEDSNSGEYYIWTHPHNNEIWTVLPKKTTASDYRYYQDKVIKMLLYALDLEENYNNYVEIHGQLLNYNYKIINRIVNSDENTNSAPYELASLLPTKNIDSFRRYFQLRTKAKQALPIENFQLNHTQHGSFVIPISIIPQQNDENGFEVIQNQTNQILHDYFEKVKKLVELPIIDKDIYAKKVFENEIDSRIVKDFLNQADSIAKYRLKYFNRVKEITITGKSSPFLDYKLIESQKEFKKVDLSEVKPIDDEYIKAIESLEIKTDTTALDEENIKVRVAIDGIHTNGVAEFKVMEIGGKTCEKPFKARAIELTRERLNICAKAFENFSTVEIVGDVSKKKGQMAKIIVGDLSLRKDPVSLLDPTNFNETNK